MWLTFGLIVLQFISAYDKLPHQACTAGVHCKINDDNVLRGNSYGGLFHYAQASTHLRDPCGIRLGLKSSPQVVDLSIGNCNLRQGVRQGMRQV